MNPQDNAHQHTPASTAKPIQSPEDIAQETQDVVHNDLVIIRFLGKSENVKRLITLIEKALGTEIWPSRPRDDFQIRGAVRVYAKIDTADLPEGV